MKAIHAVLVLLSLWLVPLMATALPPGSVDMSFNPSDPGNNQGGGPDDTVRCTAVQSSGKILIGGDFLAYDGVPAQRLARLHADGTLDTGFAIGTGLDGRPYAIAVQPDDKILVAGGFARLNGQPVFSVARLHPDGAVDTSFNTGTGVQGAGQITELLLLPDGKLLVGGNFTSYNGTAVNRLARLNADGSLDTTFNIGTGFNDHVHAMALQADGKIIVGGYFKVVQGVSRNFIARLNADGTLDTGYTPIVGLTVYALAMQADGKVIMAGEFANKLARLNTNGSYDTSFVPPSLGPAHYGAGGWVESVQVQPDGKMVVGGSFYTSITVNNNVSSRYRMIRLNADGSLDTAFSILPGIGADDIVYATALQPDGSVLVAGKFTKLNGYGPKRITRLQADGSNDTGFNPATGLDDKVVAGSLLPDGGIFLAGHFSRVQGVYQRGVALLGQDGVIDTTFARELHSSASYPSSVASRANGDLLVGGASILPYPCDNFCRLLPDGSMDSTFADVRGTVNAVLVRRNGKILLAGQFATVNGVNQPYLAQLHSNGALDTGFLPSQNYSISALAEQRDGKVVIGSRRYNTDGSQDMSYAVALSNVYAIAIQTDNKLLLGGTFNTPVNGTSAYGLVRVHPDGSIDHSFNVGTGFNTDISAGRYVFAIVAQPDGKVIVGGSFTTYQDQPANGLVRLNSDGSRDTTFEPGVGALSAPDVRVLLLQPDGKLIVAGNFTNLHGVGRNRIARISTGDSDSDGVEDAMDAFVLDPAEQYDTDLDGVGNQADHDDDGDGTPDVIDLAPLDSAVSESPLLLDGTYKGSVVKDQATLQ